MKPIPMTIERFFKVLKHIDRPATMTQAGEIRFKGGHCPLQAVYKAETGRGCHGSVSTLTERFTFRSDSRRPDTSDAVGLIIDAADAREPFCEMERRFTTRLRRRILSTLGLRGKKH